MVKRLFYENKQQILPTFQHIQLKLSEYYNITKFTAALTENTEKVYKFWLTCHMLFIYL